MAGYDFTNKKFGDLTAKKIAKRDNSGHNYWECECKCGKIVIVRATELMNGKKTMCNDCRKKMMGYTPSNKVKVTTDDIESIDNGQEWLEKNNIPQYNLDHYDNVIDIRKISAASILSAPIVYKLVHAINADLSYAIHTYIGDGAFTESLAQQYDNFFHIREQLDDYSAIDWEIGEVIYTAPIYHLLTKKDRNDIVTYDALYQSLYNLSVKAREQGNYYLAFPHICCGKDRLDWDVVLQIILHIFGDDFNIMLF